MTTPNASERMNDEVGACQMCDGCGEVLLAQNGGPNSGENVPCPSCVSTELREQIDALRAELTAARTPPTSDELAETLTRVRFSCGIDTSDRVQRAFVRLSAAKEEAERERDEARAALAQAREAALEQAARACETLTGSDATPTLRPGARMCLHRIRALKSTPTQESETP